MRVTIDTLGVEAVSRDLLRMGDRVTDLRPAMDDALEVVRDAERRQFDTQGADGSGGWDPLADSTRRMKARSGLDPRILRATGDLFESVTEEGGANISLSRHDGADFGSTLPYARLHQQGTGRIPSRPVVQLPERDRREIIRIVQRFVIEGGAR